MKLSGRFNRIMRKWYESAGGEDECWIWRFCTNGKYPIVRLNDRQLYAHRVVWSLVNRRQIPPGMDICHTCDTPLCVNPKHLWMGTRSDNIRDAWQKGRGVNRMVAALRAQTHCKHGHEFTPENTYLAQRPRYVARICRECFRASKRRYYARKSAKAAVQQA